MTGMRGSAALSAASTALFLSPLSQPHRIGPGSGDDAGRGSGTPEVSLKPPRCSVPWFLLLFKKNKNQSWAHRAPGRLIQWLPAGSLAPRASSINILQGAALFSRRSRDRTANVADCFSSLEFLASTTLWFRLWDLRTEVTCSTALARAALAQHLTARLQPHHFPLTVGFTPPHTYPQPRGSPVATGGPASHPRACITPSPGRRAARARRRMCSHLWSLDSVTCCGPWQGHGGHRCQHKYHSCGGRRAQGLFLTC